MQNRTELEWTEGDPDAPPRRRPIANRWLRDPKRRQYRGMVFEPGEDAEAGPAYNLWQGFTVAPDPRGDASPFLEHLWANVCREREELFDYLLAWFAHMVQRPRERIGTAVAIRGGQGTGKTLTGRIVGALVDDPRYLMGQFNAHLAQTLLLQADEAFWSGDKAGVGHLKGLITSDVQMIEHKGVDPVRVRNYVRLLVTSNEDWVVPAGPDERRWLVIDAGSGVYDEDELLAHVGLARAVGAVPVVSVPSGSARCARSAAAAAAASSGTAPSSRCGGIRPRTRFASVTVGRVPPRP